MLRPGLIAVAVASGAAVLAAARQQPAQTFRSGVELVSVDVSVLDKNRLPVTGLQAADFTILEDGKTRPVEAFSAVTLPPPELPPAAWMLTTAPDVATNVLPPEGRLVMILFDRSIRPEMQPRAKAVAKAAVAALRPGDLAAVLYTNRGVPQGFTADQNLLNKAIDQPFMGLPLGDEANSGECLCGMCSLEAMEVAADAVRDVPRRRKMLLYIGTDVAVDSEGAECGSRLRDAREKLIKSAQVANMTIDAVDPTGVESLADMADVQGTPNRSRAGGPAMANMVRQGHLGVYPDHTGGRTVTNTNDPPAAVAPLLRESDDYYVLGFPPASSKADGHFHKIEVKVNRRNITIQARQGYYAPGAKPAQQIKIPAGVPANLANAMATLWPKVDLPLSLDIAAFAGPDRQKAIVAVIVRAEIPGDATRPAPAGGRKVSVLSGAFDRLGKSLDFQRATLTVPSAPSSFEILTRLALRPGHYEIRSALSDDTAGLAGSVYSYVDVPNFATPAPHISGLVLGVTPPPLAGPRNAFSDVLPIVPSAAREFRATDQATAFVRVYAAAQGAIVPVRVNARVVDTADRAVFEQAALVAANQFGTDRTADYRLDLPLARLAPGEYLLSIEFLRGNTRDVRDVTFRVVK